MLIGNHNFNYEFFKKRMIVYFSDTPVRLLNIYNLKQKIPEEEFSKLVDLLKNKDKEGIVKFFEFHKETFLKLGREKVYLVFVTHPTIPQVKYLTPKILANNLDLGSVSFLKKGEIKVKRAEWNNNENIKSAVQDQLRYFTEKKVEQRLLRHVNESFSRDSIWGVLKNRARPCYYVSTKGDSIFMISLLSTIYFYNSPF